MIYDIGRGRAQHNTINTKFFILNYILGSLKLRELLRESQYIGRGVARRDW